MLSSRPALTLTLDLQVSKQVSHDISDKSQISMLHKQVQIQNQKSKIKITDKKQKKKLVPYGDWRSTSARAY